MNIKRRYELTLKLGADTMQDILSALSNLEYELSGIDERNYQFVSGSPTAGYALAIEFSPEVTHESYFAAIEEWQQNRGKSDAEE